MKDYNIYKIEDEFKMLKGFVKSDLEHNMEFLRKVILDIEDTPKSFLNPSYEADEALSVSTDLLILIWRLITVEILIVEEVLEIKTRFNNKFTYFIKKIQDKNLISDMNEYLDMKTSSIKKYALELECFEVLENLNKFNKLC